MVEAKNKTKFTLHYHLNIKHYYDNFSLNFFLTNEVGKVKVFAKSSRMMYYHNYVSYPLLRIELCDLKKSLNIMLIMKISTTKLTNLLIRFTMNIHANKRVKKIRWMGECSTYGNYMAFFKKKKKMIASIIKKRK